MGSGKRSLVMMLLLASSLGCIYEVHPEYSPRTYTSVISREATSPAATTSSVAARPAPTRPVTASVGAASRPARLATATIEGDDAPAPAQRPTRPPLPDERALALGDCERAAPDLSPARARCRTGDRASCAELPGIHLNGNVRVFGNVFLFGDVYVNDTLAATEPRERR
jgi:hypothetical protein